VVTRTPERLKLRQRNSDLKNTDVSFDDWYVSYFMSVVAAGGQSWQTGSSRSRRLEFWNWWLDLNVPGVAAKLQG
jgi:hypothetical protein